MEVEDEFQALLAIYGEDAVFSVRTKEGTINQISVKIDIADHGHCLLRADLPGDYPTSPPTVLVFADFLTKGQQNDLIAELNELGQTLLGQPVLFSYIMHVTEALSLSNQTEEEKQVPQTPAETKFAGQELNEVVVTPDIVHGETLVDRKSVFQGHCARVYSMDQVEAVMGSLLQNTKISNATHNMMAFRLRSAETKNSLVADCDDDGEKAAGKQMLHVLELLEVENVIVVVSRWYGGVPLGPARFKHIANATRQVTVEALRRWEPHDENRN